MLIAYIVSYHMKRKDWKISKEPKKIGWGENQDLCNYRMDTIDRCGCNFDFLPSQMGEKFERIRIKSSDSRRLLYVLFISVR